MFSFLLYFSLLYSSLIKSGYFSCVKLNAALIFCGREQVRGRGTALQMKMQIFRTVLLLLFLNQSSFFIWGSVELCFVAWWAHSLPLQRLYCKFLVPISATMWSQDKHYILFLGRNTQRDTLMIRILSLIFHDQVLSTLQINSLEKKLTIYSTTLILTTFITSYFADSDD